MNNNIQISVKLILTILIDFNFMFFRNSGLFLLAYVSINKFHKYGTFLSVDCKYLQRLDRYNEYSLSIKSTVLSLYSSRFTHFRKLKCSWKDL